jgi:2-haloacid dehalogenase
MLRWEQFEVMTFDCYGTLIDWETGLRTALASVFSAHGVQADVDSALEVFAELEAAAERDEYRPYRTVLQTVLAGLGARLGFAPTPEELTRFSGSVADWPAFPDSAGALQALHRTYRLAVVSNIDDDLFAASAARLGVRFDRVITAQQVRSYKPSLRNFEEAFARIGVPRDRILHVAQSLFHDIAPANRLGLSTVWVNRRKGQEGSGATPPAEAKPTLEVPDLRTLAALATNAP